MRLYRYILQLIGFTLLGCALGLMTGSPYAQNPVMPESSTVLTVRSSDKPVCKAAVGSTLTVFNEAIVAPHFTYSIAHYFCLAVGTAWVLVHRPRCIGRVGECYYYFFSYFRRLFSHHIVINAP